MKDKAAGSLNNLFGDPHSENDPKLKVIFLYTPFVKNHVLQDHFLPTKFTILKFVLIHRNLTALKTLTNKMEEMVRKKVKKDRKKGSDSGWETRLYLLW